MREGRALHVGFVVGCGGGVGAVALAVLGRGGGPAGAVRFAGAVVCCAVGDGLVEGLVQPDTDTDKQMMRISEIEIAIAVFFFILVTSFNTVLLAILRAHFFSTLQR
jgi:hypothetical protein